MQKRGSQQGVARPVERQGWQGVIQPDLKIGSLLDTAKRCFQGLEVGDHTPLDAKIIGHGLGCITLEHGFSEARGLGIGPGQQYSYRNAGLQAADQLCSVSFQIGGKGLQDRDFCLTVIFCCDQLLKAEAKRSSGTAA
jgi:hypothetical protein